MSTGTGTVSWIEVMASCAFVALRAPRYIRDGLCLASWIMASFPRPMLPIRRIMASVDGQVELQGGETYPQ